MANDKSHKRLPPYVSYRTFHNFIEGLRQQMPARIDRSYWSSTLSGSTGTQLMAALRFLELIDANGRPAERMRSLVAARGEQKAELLKDIVTDAFGFVFKGALDPENATYAQLEEAFYGTFQCTGEVARKCIKFFIALSSDAGVPLSPFITKKIKPVYTHSISGTGKIRKRSGMAAARNSKVPNEYKEIADQNSWNEMLLSKFPSFDPDWNDEVKLKWFAAFDELLRRNQ